MAGKFEVYRDKADKYRFRLKAGNGEIIAVGEAYESKASCLNGIESVKANAPSAPVIEKEKATP
ncbi:YegP family protein [Streptomyces sp. NPDC048717]|uniref:YegP family protein n=1 Tax=Streptomyces sp. NPDC048717 TaxID=3154928 RepID=UPI003437CB33